MNEAMTGRYMIHLIYSLLNHTKPDEKPDDIPFEDIYRMSVKHNVCVMTLSAIEQLQTKPDDQLYRKWDRKRNAAIAQSVVQLLERDSILQMFEKEQIEVLPLKGCHLKEMYPKPEYREMADLDMLIHQTDRLKVRKIMESLGYETEKFEDSKDDSYRKAPFMHVEIHNRLFDEITLSQMNVNIDLLKQPFDHAQKQADSSQYSLKPEDFYVYLIIHNAKHALINGCGIRQFIDLDIFRSNYKMDECYIHEQLGHTDIEWFASDAEKLVSCWRSGQPVPENLKEMEEIIFSSGSYGNHESKIRNHIRRAEKGGRKSAFRYMMFRLFPDYSFMKAIYPVLRKAPFLMPILWIYRLLFKGLPKMRKYKDEYNTYLDIHSKNQ